MCEFKFCRGKGKCFLSGSSPCPGQTSADQPTGATTRAVKSLGLRYDGFLDRDELIAVLDLDEVHSPVPTAAEVVAITSKQRAKPKTAKRKKARVVA